MSQHIERSHYLQIQLAQLEDERQAHCHAIENLDKKIALLKDWVTESKQLLCSSCNGYGHVRCYFAQDDVKAIPCGVCKGSGIA